MTNLNEAVPPEYIADNPDLPPCIERAFLRRAPHAPIPDNDLGIDLPIFDRPT
jgi:hypothetical protein